MVYIATFYTHYGALTFKKQCLEESVKMMPVPREISASCGVCIQFEGISAPKVDEHEDMECCYIVDLNGGYIPVYE